MLTTGRAYARESARETEMVRMSFVLTVALAGAAPALATVYEVTYDASQGL